MLLELHCHTQRYSPCSHLDPVEAVQRVSARGLQGLVLTEHHYLWAPTDLAALKRQAEVDDSFVLLAGQEVETDVGHVLVLGAEEHVAPVQLAVLRQRYPDAALVWAHPFRHDVVPPDHALRNPLVDALELFNSNHTARAQYYAISAWHRVKFVATSGSDAHSLATAGTLPTYFDHPVTDVRELVAEIRRGRCRPLFREIPLAGTSRGVTATCVGRDS